MKVEVEAQQIADLERQLQTVATLLTAIVSTRPKGVRVTQAQLDKGGSVQLSNDGDDVLLSWAGGD